MPLASDIGASVELLRTLVAFPTVSRDSNLELIEFVRDYMEKLGARLRLTYDDQQRKANLVATLGPAAEGGIVLSGHTDVVPADPRLWDSDPFTLIQRNDRLYGRGAADMKGFLAVVLALAPDFARCNLSAPLHLAFSYDEEVGCLGVGRLIADLQQAGIQPASCIVGEPTMMRPVIAHKGKHTYRCTVRGLACHSAYAPLGVNAVEAAADAVAYLRRMARRYRDQGPYDHSFDIAHTTVHTGVLHGGSALNIVPDECLFDFEFRHLPGDAPERMLAEFRQYVSNELEPEMKAIDTACGFTVTRLSMLPALDNGPETEVVALAQALSESAEISKVSFGTEAAHFQHAGIPAVICGPGSIEQAHKANEFVTVNQLLRCHEFLQRLMLHISSD